MLLEKCPRLRTSAEGWSAAPSKVRAGEIAAFELLELDFDLEPPGCIVSECVR
jgi:hypothetical protein